QGDGLARRGKECGGGVIGPGSEAVGAEPAAGHASDGIPRFEWERHGDLDPRVHGERQVGGRYGEDPEVTGGDQVRVGAQPDVVHRHHGQGPALAVDEPGCVDIEALGVDAHDQMQVHQRGDVDATRDPDGAAERLEIEVRRAVERLVDRDV